MIQAIKEMIKIELGQRKLIGLFSAYFTGSLIEIVTGHTKQWFWIAIIYGLFAGFNFTSKMLSFKKNGNG